MTRFLVLGILILGFAGDSYAAPIPCNNSDSCPSATPICYTFATNRTLRKIILEQSSRANLFLSSDTTTDIAVKEGYCVQCKSDCDCGINQYCGIDPDTSNRVTFQGYSLSSLPSPSATFNFSQSLRNDLEDMVNKTSGWIGIPMRSKCLDYDVPSTTCTKVSDAGRSVYGPFVYVTGTGYSKTAVDPTKTPTVYQLKTVPYNTTSKDSYNVERPTSALRFMEPTADSDFFSREFYASGKFCGRISPEEATMPVFVPAFLKVAGKNDPFADTSSAKYDPSNFVRPDRPDNHQDYASSSTDFNTAKYCSKHFRYGEDSFEKALCGTSFTYSTPIPAGSSSNEPLFKVEFETSAIAWRGFCQTGKCAICKNGDRRCSGLRKGGTGGSTEERGIPQLCQDGKWVSADFNDYSPIKSFETDTDLRNIEVRGMQAFVKSAYMNSALQAQVAIAVFIALFTPAVVGLCVLELRRGSGPAAGKDINSAPAGSLAFGGSAADSRGSV